MEGRWPPKSLEGQCWDGGEASDRGQSPWTGWLEVRGSLLATLGTYSLSLGSSSLPLR